LSKCSFNFLCAPLLTSITRNIVLQVGEKEKENNAANNGNINNMHVGINNIGIVGNSGNVGLGFNIYIGKNGIVGNACSIKQW
jgi:hypothetical protein